MNEISSPGGWKAPNGTKPGWNWAPPSGAIPNFRKAPMPIRLVEKIPFIDRLVYPWLWQNGFFLVHKPGTKPDYSGEKAFLYKKSK
jgi:hypothetical protein